MARGRPISNETLDILDTLVTGRAVRVALKGRRPHSLRGGAQKAADRRGLVVIVHLIQDPEHPGEAVKMWLTPRGMTNVVANLQENVS